MRSRLKTRFVLAALVFTTVALDAAAEVVPDVLPDPDTTPPATDKPVKVYILAGQSNMVGMGDISGARNTYTGVFYTSDPAAPTGPMDIYRVGKYKIAPLAVYRPDGTPTVKPIARGQVEVPETGVYEVHCGSGERSCNVMELDGKQVYRRMAGGKPARQDVTLQAGTGEGNQNALCLHFGLGTRVAPVDLEVLWPGGDAQTLGSVEVDRTIEVMYGKRLRSAEAGTAVTAPRPPEARRHRGPCRSCRGVTRLQSLTVPR